MGEIIVQSKLSAFLSINIRGYASLLGNELRFLQHCKCQVNHNSEEICPKIIAHYPLSAEEQNEKSRWYALLHYLTEIL